MVSHFWDTSRVGRIWMMDMNLAPSVVKEEEATDRTHKWTASELENGIIMSDISSDVSAASKGICIWRILTNTWW